MNAKVGAEILEIQQQSIIIRLLPDTASIANLP